MGWESSPSFGAAFRSSVGVLSGEQQQSFALNTAAENLLAKAQRALRAGDEQGARTWVDRALSLPFDNHEGLVPGVHAAAQGFFNLVTDIIEDWPEDDTGWIDVLAELRESATSHAGTQVQHVIAVLVQDRKLLSVSDWEANRLARLTPGGDAMDIPELEVPEGERADFILDMLQLTQAFSDLAEDLAR